MAYDLAKISMTALMRPAFDACIALTRLDERIARSPVGAGFLERQNFADACASLWIDGELVHLEDLVLHDAFRDTRTPTHELTIARDVLRTRRRISGQSADWALSAEGIRVLRQTSDAGAIGAETLQGKGPFTVFAPTNEAFAALPKSTVDTLLKPENKAQLTKVLTCHVVAANAMSMAIEKMIKDDKGTHDVNTVGGCVLKAKESMGKITLTDENGNVANVTIADVKQSNGVIHVIDKVLLPKM